MDEDERLREQRIQERKVIYWAQQSITWAIFLRASKSGSPFKPGEDVKFAQQEVESRTKELWEEVLSEMPERIGLQDVIEAYANKVFDWCYSHMNPEK